MGTTKRRPLTGISPKRFAEALVRGSTFEEANLRAGYSISRSKRGRACASKECWTEYNRQLNARLEELKKYGGQFTPEDRVKIIRGKGLRNIAEGKDESVASMKLLGQDRELNMFTPDSVCGIVVMEMPKAFQPGGILDPAAFARNDRQGVIQHLEAKLRQREERLLELGEKDRGDCDWAERDKRELARLRAEEAAQ